MSKLGGVSASTLNNMERALLILTDHDLFVSVDEYDTYLSAMKVSYSRVHHAKSVT